MFALTIGSGTGNTLARRHHLQVGSTRRPRPEDHWMVGRCEGVIIGTGRAPAGGGGRSAFATRAGASCAGGAREVRPRRPRPRRQAPLRGSSPAAGADGSRTQVDALAVRFVHACLRPDDPPEFAGSSSALAKISARIQNRPPMRTVIAWRLGPPHPSAPAGRPSLRYQAVEGPQPEAHPSRLIDAQLPPK